MRINLPPQNGKACEVDASRSIVLIGANGSGKTRMSVWVEKNNSELSVHRIPAQKSLKMPKTIKMGEIGSATDTLLYGAVDDDKQYLRDHAKFGLMGRWHGRPATHEIDDFDSLLTLLVTDEANQSIEYRRRQKNGEKEYDNRTIFDCVREIWCQVITDKDISISSGKFTTITKQGDRYNGAEMSDGEREVVYFIAEALCVPEASLVIVDEPENHLHEAILDLLWDAIERARPDCCFMYLTHKLSFAAHRDSQCIVWVKSMDALDSWQYEMLSGEDGLPEPLLLEILGSRRDVVLVEGEGSKGWDRQLYQLLMPDRTIIARGGCSQVVQEVKAFRSLDLLVEQFNVSGVVDRDCKSDEEAKSLKDDGVTCLKVAEIENAFLLPCVVRFALRRLGMADESDGAISEMQEKVLGYLSDKLEQQLALHVKAAVRNRLNEIAGIKAHEANDYVSQVSDAIAAIDYDGMVAPLRSRFQAIINQKDYYGALEVINNKGLYQETGLKEATGLDKGSYFNLVLRLLGDRSSSERATEVDEALRMLRRELGLGD